ncbi:hypothetical protein DFJ74DRAFT_704975 [Hyaloraphidium curvatum]|nr:hypothetical protein DFJ74DRAFT_704975 [Hyaloraphidium curvatum]
MPGRLVNKSTGQGKIVIITGGGSGIGAAATLRFAQEGARVAIFDLPRQKEGAHALMRRIRDEVPGAPEVAFFEMDVRDEGQWEACIKAVEDRWGPIDALVNNAGLDASAKDIDALEDITLAKWNRTMDVNAGGVFLGTKHGIKSMKKNQNPVSAVRILTKSTAMYCARRGYNIRCNSVHPGVIDTPGTRGNEERVKQVLRHLTPMGRFGQPEEIANAMLFLVSDEASFMRAFKHTRNAGAAAVGEPVLFFRQRENPYDSNAVAVCRTRATPGASAAEHENVPNQLGFLPATFVRELAPLLDSGVATISGTVLQAPDARWSMKVSLSISITPDYYDRASGSLKRALELENTRSPAARGKVPISPPQLPANFASLPFDGICVLSLFTGIGGDLVALKRAGIRVGRVLSFELNRECAAVVTKNHSNVFHLGNVESFTEEMARQLGPIDFVIGGSPCQDLSRAKGPDRLGLNGSRSKLFFHIPRILEIVDRVNAGPKAKPHVPFLLENVYGMPSEDLQTISRDWTNLRVQPLVTPWPEPNLADMLVSGYPLEHWRKKAVCIVRTTHGTLVRDPRLTEQPYAGFTHEDPRVRPLLPVEEERLLGFPDNYTLLGTVSQASNLRRHEQLGNSFSTQVVQQIVAVMKVAATLGTGQGCLLRRNETGEQSVFIGSCVQSASSGLTPGFAIPLNNETAPLPVETGAPATLNLGLIIGASVGGLIVVWLIAAVTFWALARPKKKKQAVELQSVETLATELGSH